MCSFLLTKGKTQKNGKKRNQMVPPDTVSQLKRENKPSFFCRHSGLKEKKKKLLFFLKGILLKGNSSKFNEKRHLLQLSRAVASCGWCKVCACPFSSTSTQICSACLLALLHTLQTDPKGGSAPWGLTCQLHPPITMDSIETPQGPTPAGTIASLASPGLFPAPRWSLRPRSRSTEQDSPLCTVEALLVTVWLSEVSAMRKSKGVLCRAIVA